jgi:hypothetical protein
MWERQSRSVSKLVSIAEEETRRGCRGRGSQPWPLAELCLLRYAILEHATWPLDRVRHLLRSHETLNSVGKAARRSIVIVSYHSDTTGELMGTMMEKGSYGVHGRLCARISDLVQLILTCGFLPQERSWPVWYPVCKVLGLRQTTPQGSRHFGPLERNVESHETAKDKSR